MLIDTIISNLHTAKENSTDQNLKKVFEVAEKYITNNTQEVNNILNQLDNRAKYLDVATEFLTKMFEWYKSIASYKEQIEFIFLFAQGITPFIATFTHILCVAPMMVC